MIPVFEQMGRAAKPTKAKRTSKTNEPKCKRIWFFDGGQDFARWDLDPMGRVIDSWVFQSMHWCQYIVTNHATLAVGDCVNIVHFKNGGEKYTIRYPITKIEEFTVEEMAKAHAEQDARLAGKGGVK